MGKFCSRRRNNTYIVIFGFPMLLVFYWISIGLQSQSSNNFHVPLANLNFPPTPLPRPTYDPTLIDDIDDDGLSEVITVVTAYLDLGHFQKAERRYSYGPNRYTRWFKPWARIRNPVIAYFDNQKHLDKFKKIRLEMLPANLTKLVLVNRDQLWSFGLKETIAVVLKQHEYPKIEPNTVLPEYGCTMHAKYELMLQAISQNHFKTKYFCWTDIGVYRDMARDTNPTMLTLQLPSDFDPSSVAFNLVKEPFPYKVHPREIFLQEFSIWVAGGFFLAEHRVMRHWVEEYMYFVEYFLARGFSNSDQQLIYAIFNGGLANTTIQVYAYDADRVKRTRNYWFYLPYLCMES